MKIFFFAKKLAGAMLMPLQFSLLLIVIGVVLLWLNRMRKLALGLVTAGTVLLLIFSNRYVGYHLVHHLETRYPPLQLSHSAGEQASAGQPGIAMLQDGTVSTLLGKEPVIVVLSAGASDDTSLPITDRLTPDSALRVVEAVRIYRDMKSSPAGAPAPGRSPGKQEPNSSLTPRVLMSGGATVNRVPEAIPMKRLAELLGVPGNDILMEMHSEDTASEARDVLPFVGHKPFILVTSAYHMPRSMALFRHQGMRPIAAPSNYLGRWTTKPFLLNIPPNSGALLESETAWHEELGMFWEHLRGQL